MRHTDLREILLGTGDAELVERARQDTYSADGGDGSGRNRLGVLPCSYWKSCAREGGVLRVWRLPLWRG